MEEHDKKVAERLSAFRKKFVHKSQTKAGPMLGMNQSRLWYIENAKSPVSFELIAKLVNEYQLNTDWLANGNGDMIDKNPPKKDLLTDINELNREIALLQKGIKIIEINQKYMMKKMEEMEKKLAKKNELFNVKK